MAIRPLNLIGIRLWMGLHSFGISEWMGVPFRFQMKHPRGLARWPMASRNCSGPVKKNFIGPAWPVTF